MLTGVTVPRNSAASVSSGRENKWGGVRVIMTVEVCECVCIPLGHVSVPLRGKLSNNPT